MGVGTQIPAEAKATLERAADDAVSWVVWLARFGLAAKGVVYFTVGILALQAALGIGGRTTDTRGALVSLYGQPFGQVLLGLVAVGLFGYALWRMVEGWVDPEGAGTSAKGIARRAGHVVSGLIYGGLGVQAVRILLGARNIDMGNQQEQGWAAELMAQPLGYWLVALAGLFMIGVGIYQWVAAYRAKFMLPMKQEEMSAKEITWMRRSGQLGYAARGVISTLIGLFLLLAAWHSDPSEAGGIAKALAELARQPYGPWLLGIVAAGLMAYGLFAMVQARYRRIHAGEW